jgi:hypothetical protein
VVTDVALLLAKASFSKHSMWIWLRLRILSFINPTAIKRRVR